MSFVDGFAFAPDEVFEHHKAEHARLVELVGEESVIVEIKHGYNHTKYLLDPVRTKDLTLFEKCLLANRGPLPFGGRAEGSWVVVHTD